MNNSMMKSVQDTKDSVLLVYPGTSKYKTGAYAENFFPMGLLYVGGEILSLGLDVKYIDLTSAAITDVAEEDYLFVGFTVLTGQMIEKSLEFARHVKTYNSNIPIVFGGIHPTILPDQTLQNNLVDFVIIGEGEETVKELITELRNGKNFKNIQGLGYKQSGKIFVNPNRAFIDLNKTKIELPYEIFNIRRSSTFTGPFPVHTSRGCPWRCTFCYNAGVNKRRYRTKSALRVVNEIEYLIKTYNISDYSFGNEDEFFIDTKRVRSILNEIVEKKLKTTWGAFCRFDTLEKIDEDYLELIKKSGGDTLVFGGESGSERLLKEIIKKDITVEQMVIGVNKLKNAKIPHIVSFICGFPTESIEDIRMTFKLIEDLYFENPYLWVQSIYMLTPLPGTELFDLLKAEYGYKPPQTLEEWGAYEMPFASWKYLTWLDKNYAMLCNDIHIWSTYNPFYYLNSHNNREKNHFQNDRAPYFINHIMGKIQRLRIKYLFFKLPLEHNLFSFVFGLNTIYQNRLGLIRLVINVTKKYLPTNVFMFIKKLVNNGRIQA